MPFAHESHSQNAWAFLFGNQLACVWSIFVGHVASSRLQRLFPNGIRFDIILLVTGGVPTWRPSYNLWGQTSSVAMFPWLPQQQWPLGGEAEACASQHSDCGFVRGVASWKRLLCWQTRTKLGGREFLAPKSPGQECWENQVVIVLPFHWQMFVRAVFVKTLSLAAFVHHNSSDENLWSFGYQIFHSPWRDPFSIAKIFGIPGAQGLSPETRGFVKGYYTTMCHPYSLKAFQKSLYFFFGRISRIVMGKGITEISYQKQQWLEVDRERTSVGSRRFSLCNNCILSQVTSNSVTLAKVPNSHGCCKCESTCYHH